MYKKSEEAFGQLLALILRDEYFIVDAPIR